MSTQEATPIPLGMALTPANPAYQADPYSLLDAVREAGRVHYDEFFHRYVVSGFDDVEAILHDRSLAVDPRKAAPDTFNAIFRNRAREDREPSMLFLDPPDHTRLRALVQKAFTPRAVERMAPRIARIADELLDAVDGQESFDLMAAFAAPLPTIVIAEMLGIDPADRADFKRWSDTGVAAGFDPFADEETKRAAETSGVELEAYLRKAIAARRAAPGDDLITGMIQAEDAGDFLNDDEIRSMISLLLAAGNVTTTDLIGNGVLLLLQHPEQYRLLREDHGLIKNAVEEMLRVAAPVTFSGRITTEDREIAGCPVHAGQSITVSLAGAAYDPAANADPHRFDVTRAEPKHLAFGGGRRYCLGAPLARLEAVIGLDRLVMRFPNLRPAEQELVYKRVPGFRGLERLNVVP